MNNESEKTRAVAALAVQWRMKRCNQETRRSLGGQTDRERRSVNISLTVDS